MPVAANRSRLVLHAYERTFYTPSLSSRTFPLSSRTLPLFLIPTSARRRKGPRSKNPIPAKPISPSLMFVAVPWRRGNVSIQILPIVRTRDMFDSYQTNLPQANRAIAFI